MASQQSVSDTTTTAGQGERRTRRPAGYRWLSVLIPQQSFNHLHIQARLSNMSFREYVERWCQEAFPLASHVSQGGAPEQAQAATK